MHPTALERLVPGTVIAYTDFEHAKNFCRDYPDSGLRGQLGGSKVAERHYCNLTFDDLRLTWLDGDVDEFIELYETMVKKVS